jgi:hypothetical protein
MGLRYRVVKFDDYGSVDVGMPSWSDCEERALRPSNKETLVVDFTEHRPTVLGWYINHLSGTAWFWRNQAMLYVEVLTHRVYSFFFLRASYIAAESALVAMITSKLWDSRVCC